MGRFETIRRTRFLVITMCFISMVILSACGRTMSVADSDSENASGNDTVYDVSSETGDAPLTTAQGILQKKARKFIKANADTSVMKDGDIKNILIVGQDRREENKAEMRSDSMMIFSINTVTDEINLVSLMRDMYLPCADGKDGMINMTYLNGGAELLSQTIEMNFGVHIDNYIETDFWRFMELYDHIGPVDIELTAEEATYLNDMSHNSRVKYYDYGDTKPVWTLYAGVNALDPEQMLSFCRIRQNIGGDWARTDRQRRAITATYQKLNSMSYAGLIRTIQENGHYLNTDMDIYDMLGYFYWLKKNDITKINSYRIPLDGTYSQEIREGDLQVLIPQIEANQQAMQQYIFGN